MIEYLYDGTFEGLLTAIFYAYPQKDSCAITREDMYIPNMLDKPIIVPTEYNKFKRVYNSITEKLNTEVLTNIYYLYLSEVKSIENIILTYLKLCYKNGTSVNLAKNNDTILLVDKYCRRVTFESHRFAGFVRFKEIAPFSFYSAIEPDYNIIPILMPHFIERFSDQNFIIHDLKREIALIYNQNSYFITTLSKEEGLRFSKSNDDSNFQNLWKTFYNSINIEERKNLKQQSQYMPKRYWCHLPEI